MTQQPAQQNPFNTPQSEVQPSKNKPKNKGLLILLVVVGLGFFGIFVLGILAAIAIPNFLKYQSRARQSEAKINLKGLYTQQQMYRVENATYAGTFGELGWAPEPGHRYTYFMGSARLDADGAPAAALNQPLIPSTVEDFRAYAVGNIDGDDALDVWSIDAANQLVNLTNDVQE